MLEKRGHEVGCYLLELAIALIMLTVVDMAQIGIKLRGALLNWGRRRPRKRNRPVDIFLPLDLLSFTSNGRIFPTPVKTPAPGAAHMGCNAASATAFQLPAAGQDIWVGWLGGKPSVYGR